MNHYDLLIRDFLLNYKSLSLEKIGTLTIDEKSLPAHHLPLQFQYDKKAITTPELITYIVERTGKSKVLIQSDIESFTELMRQLINIGNPYEIERVGAFRLAQSGEYEFIAYDIPVGKEEQKISKKHQPTGLMPLNKRSSNKSALMLVSFIIILGILGVIGWGAYNFFVNSAKKPTPADTVVATAPSVADTTASATDSITLLRDTTQKDTTTMATTDTAEYKFIYETTSSSARANIRTNQLISFGDHAAFDSIATDTGNIYQLYIKMKLYYADTARAKDSLERYLQRNIKIARAN